MNAYVVIHEQEPDGSRTTLAVHCGGWRLHEPSGPRFVFSQFVKMTEAESLNDDESRKLALEQAGAVWQVAEQSGWRTWESCPSEGGRPRWVVEIDDGDAAATWVSCDGDLPASWRATFDSLEALNLSERYDYDGEYWKDELGVY